MGKAVFTGLSHICIFVENVEKAIQYYKRILGAVPKQYIPHFRNPGFFEAGGFLKEAGDADVSIGIMEVPGAGLVLELMCYHYPKGRQTPMFFRANDISGARYIALKVANIEEAFEYIKSQSDVTLINTSEEYRVFKLSNTGMGFLTFLRWTEELMKKTEMKKVIVGCDSGISMHFSFTSDLRERPLLIVHSAPRG